MPNVFAYGLATTPNITTDIPLNLLARQRMLFGRATETTTMFFFNAGRLRHPRIVAGKNTMANTGFTKRLRSAFVDLIVKNITKAFFSVSSPASLVPTGQVWHNLKRLEESPIIRGGNYDIHYEFVGRKLQHLYTTFTIKTLSNEVLIEKGFALVNGGVCVDSAIVLENGKDQITGSVFLLPHETQKLPEEVKYSVSIGDLNNSSRRYFTNFGFLTTIAP